MYQGTRVAALRNAATRGLGSSPAVPARRADRRLADAPGHLRALGSVGRHDLAPGPRRLDDYRRLRLHSSPQFL